VGVAGLMYVGLVVAWAVVGVQFLIRRHDEVSESHSVERFSQAMRVLSRRSPTPDQRYVVMPARPVVEDVVATEAVRMDEVRHDAPATAAGDEDNGVRRRLSGRIFGERAVVVDEAGDERPDPDFWLERPVRGRQRIVMRRRRVLLGLVALTAITAVAAAFTSLPVWTVLAAVVVLAGYVLHLRVQTRQAAEFDRRREAARARLRARQRRINSAERVVAVRRAREDERVASLAAAEAELFEREEAERLAAEAAAARAWQPVPVPLPTYVTKPKAMRAHRSVEADAAPVAVTVDQPVDQPFDQETDTPAADGWLRVEHELEDRRRAVND
jgi:hypothetical protein